jgi:hypothetical protein
MCACGETLAWAAIVVFALFLAPYAIGAASVPVLLAACGIRRLWLRLLRTRG